MTRAELDEIVAELRERHEELRRRLTWHGIQRVLKRARIRYDVAPLDVPALLLTHGGVSVVLLNADLPVRAHTEALAHEFAHIQLHAGEPGELVFHVWRPGSADPREEEADYLASCLLAGPGVDVEGASSTRPGANPIPSPTEAVVPFPDPYASPLRPRATRMPRREPRYGGRDGESALARAIRLAREAKPAKRELRAGPNDDGRILYEQGRVRFIDEHEVRWTIHDVAFFTQPDGSTRREVVRSGSETAAVRYFVNVLGGRRLYRFERLELRRLRVSHLERQLRDSLSVDVAAHEQQQRA